MLSIRNFNRSTGVSIATVRIYSFFSGSCDSRCIIHDFYADFRQNRTNTNILKIRNFHIFPIWKIKFTSVTLSIERIGSQLFSVFPRILRKDSHPHPVPEPAFQNRPGTCQFFWEFLIMITERQMWNTDSRLGLEDLLNLISLEGRKKNGCPPHKKSRLENLYV